jgi:cell division protein FtsZ
LFDRSHEPETYAAEPEDMIDNDLPPPAYRPQAAAPRSYGNAALDADAASFVAPSARAPGAPSPEAIARLQAALSKGQQPARGPVAQAQPARNAAPAAKPAESRPRFGIGGLISRMAGGGQSEPQERASAGRAQPPVTAYDDEQEHSSDNDRIEIPAFLRRQAN